MSSTASASSASSTQAAPLPAKTPYMVAVICGLATFMEVLDTSIANVALPHIGGTLSASQDEATWVLTSYLVANAIILPMTGWLADAIGSTRYYIGSIVLFTVASVLCGMAPSLPMLILFRVIQGFAGGALQPVSQSIIADAFPPEKRGAAFGIFGAAIVCGPAIGPPLGGFLTDTYSWHWIFLINAPVGVILTVAALRVLRDSPAQLEAQRRRREEPFTVDYLGFGLIALAMGALQITLDKGEQEDWLDSSFIRSTVFIAVSSIVTLVWWELRHPHPVVNLRLFRNGNFTVSCIAMTGLGMSMLGAIVLMPQFMQTILGYSAMDAGVVLAPGALLLAILMPLGAWLGTKFDPRLMISIGFLLTAVTLALTGLYMSLDVSQAQLMLMRLIQMVGMCLLMVPVMALAYHGVAPTDGGNASAIMNLMRNLGSSIGVSLAVAWLARDSQVFHNQLVARISPLDPVYQETMAKLSTSMSVDTAHAMLAANVSVQGTVMSYTNGFFYFALITAAMVPLIWFTRRPPKNAATPLGAH
jgi:DHA2 family multidrug resistance protein